MSEHRSTINEGNLFAALPTVDEEANRRLHQRLVDAANAAGLLDVAYRTLDTPVGTLLLAATQKGLVRVAYASQDHDLMLEQLARDVSPRILRAPARLDGVARGIEEYFARRRSAFDVPLDLQLSHGFRRTVLSHLLEIDYGKTASYAAVAKASGHPRAVRAVGSACANNPLPIVVPCHRIVRSDGTIGQYVGGVEAKKTLLTLEAPHEHQCDFERGPGDPRRPDRLAGLGRRGQAGVRRRGVSEQGQGTETYTLLEPDRRLHQSPTPGTLGGHKQGRLYGRLDCPAALRILARGGYSKNRVFFADEQTAIAAGYRPCAACLPEKYAQWKARRDQEP